MVLVLLASCQVVFFGYDAFATASNIPASATAITLCDQLIRSAGIPIDGISDWPVKRIDFKPEATEEQKALAWEIVKNFNYEQEISKVKNPPSLISFYGDAAPNLTEDGQMAVATVSGVPYIYFRADGMTHHILGSASFEISPQETIDALSGEKMQIGDFVIGMIDRNLQNGATPDESSLHGVWVKWSSVKTQLIEEIVAAVQSAGPDGGFLSSASLSAISGVSDASLGQKVKNILASIGIGIENGITKIRDLVVDSLTAKKAKIDELEIERIQAKDKITGEAYCTWLENGEWVKQKGECGNAGAPAVQEPADEGESLDAPAQTQEPTAHQQETLEESTEVAAPAADLGDSVKEHTVEHQENQLEPASQEISEDNAPSDAGDGEGETVTPAPQEAPGDFAQEDLTGESGAKTPPADAVKPEAEPDSLPESDAALQTPVEAPPDSAPESSAPAPDAAVQ